MDVPSLNVNQYICRYSNSRLLYFYLRAFRIQSHGTGIVKLKSLTTMKYIAIGNLGQIYSTVGAKRVEVILITMNTVTGFN